VEEVRRAKTRGGGPKNWDRVDLLGGLLECVCGRQLRNDGTFADAFSAALNNGDTVKVQATGDIWYGDTALTVDPVYLTGATTTIAGSNSWTPLVTTLPTSADQGRPAERYALMWSGGKDGALALLRARARGLAVTRLVNFYDGESGRVRFHATRAALIAAQASAIGIELRQIATSWPEYEPAFRDMLAGLRRDGFAGVLFGDIHLADVRTWYEERVRAVGLTHVEPLWGEPPAALLAEFVASGSRAVITCTEDGKLDESWLGRIIDDDFVRDIAALPIDPAGENGEYHSFAFAGPLFRTPVVWRPGERRRDGKFSQLDLESSAGGNAAGSGASSSFFVGTGADRTLVAGDYDAWPAGHDQIADSGIDSSF